MADIKVKVIGSQCQGHVIIILSMATGSVIWTKLWNAVGELWPSLRGQGHMWFKGKIV